MNRFDVWLDRASDRLRGHALADRTFYTASRAADHSVLWHVLAVGVALPSAEPLSTWLPLALALGFESLLVNVGIKSLFRRQRPLQDHPRPHHLRRPRTSSFPSGHATSGFMAAVVLTSSAPPLAPLWFLLATVVAWSRVHVRIHHGTDVVAGALLGAALGFGVVRVWPI